jgi:hypothetical protein
LLVATLVTGWLIRKVRRKAKLLFKVHRVLAVVTVLSALCHGGLVVYYFH